MGNALEGTAGHAEVMIIGGGPTGVGAAYRLTQHGNESWILLDAEKQPGGMAGSIRTHEGFRFDHGYKTFFSRYDYLDRLLEECYATSSKKLVEKSRDNYVYVRGRMIRFPLQNNLSGLPESDQISCSLDLLKARILNSQRTKQLHEIANQFKEHSIASDENPEQLSSDAKETEGSRDLELKAETQSDEGSEVKSDVKSAKEEDNETLDQYLLRNWGESLCNIFFRPYIFKSFAYPTTKLSAKWADYKIPPSQIGDDLDRLVKGEQRDPGLDSNSVTFYPSHGGLVSLWRGLVRKLPKENVRFKSEITELDIEERTVKTKDGLEIKYNTLISTMPVTSLLELAGRSDLAESLFNSSLHVVCLGVRGTSPHKDITGCIYFPESDCIFHRACVFSSFDPDSVPGKDEALTTMRFAKEDEEVDQTPSGNDKGPYWSLILEVSGGALKTVYDTTIMNEVIRDACAVGLLRPNDEIVSIHLTEMTHGQPLPTQGSEAKIDEALRWLQTKGIYSRGKFGCFKYHLGDLDHCIMQGVEAVDHILLGAPERCVWSSPDEVNCRPNKKISYPAYDLNVMGDIMEGEGISAGSIRSAIVREPASSTSSFTATASPSSRSRSSSSQPDDVAQLSDSETASLTKEV